MLGAELLSRLRSLIVFACALLSLLITGLAVTSSAIIADHSDSGIINTADGTGETPFVYRAFLPQLTNAIAYITPQVLQESVAQGARSLAKSTFERKMFILDERIGAPQMWQTHNLYRITIYICLMYAALLAYALLLEPLAQSFFPEKKIFALIAPLYGLFIVLPFVDKDFHGYDFPSLMFFALMLLCMQRQQWKAYLLCFALSCFNRETTLLMLGVFLVTHYKSMDRAMLLKLAVLQAVIWLAEIGLLHSIFAANHAWIGPERLYIIGDELRSFGTEKLLALLALWLLLSSQWQRMPLLLKNIAWLLPLYIGLYLGFGMFREYRVFYDIFPFAALITGYTLFHKLGEQPATSKRI